MDVKEQTATLNGISNARHHLDTTKIKIASGFLALLPN